MTVSAHIPHIAYRAEGGVAWLVIDQPARMNAMTFDMWTGLADCVARAEADDGVRVIAITGAGERAFCAGADISQFGTMRTGEAAVAAYDRAVARGNAALADAVKPTVAVISGICYGGGFGLAMCCDLRIAASGSRFRIPAARLGLGYGYGGTDLMVRKLGMGPVADLLLSARVLEAQEAQGLGVINALFPVDSFRTDATAYLARIAANAPLTLRAIKRALVEMTKAERDRDAGAVDALVAACFASTDYREGQLAFREKREPVFTGR
ncbi:MAG: enoyl-CoA hydratase [Acetobacteraceae bacterium]|nr:enoyl-CoA hydratase [Acetobacteraceae bacterium]